MDDKSKKFQEILHFVLNALDKEQDSLIDEMIDYILDPGKNKHKESLCIGLITERLCWNEKCLQNLENEIKKIDYHKLVVDIVTIDGLDKFIEDFYGELGCGVIRDEEQ